MDQREIELHIYHKTSVKVFRPHQISPSCLGSMSFRPMHDAVMDSGRNLLLPPYIWMPAQLSAWLSSVTHPGPVDGSRAGPGPGCSTQCVLDLGFESRVTGPGSGPGPSPGRVAGDNQG